MSNKNAKSKLKYETPVLVALGEMGKGAGLSCNGGSNANPGNCTSVGTTAQSYCASGSTAQAEYCSAGTSAQTACTAGSTATTAACTTGNLPGA